MATKQLTLCLAQTGVSPLPDENLQTARRMLERAKAQGVDLVVFPEMFMARPEPGVSLTTVAETVDGPFVTGLSLLAQKFGVAIICGVWGTVPEGEQRVANVVVAIGTDGKLLARYNKLHLFDALNVRESDLMARGDIAPPVFPFKDMQLGLGICYDLRFPELFRDLALRGAEVVIVPSAWYAGPLKEEQWLTLLKARAIENTIYVAGANLCNEPFAARSAIFDPFGVMIAGAGETEALVVGKIERDRIEEIRSKLPCLQHVRGDIFHG